MKYDINRFLKTKHAKAILGENYKPSLAQIRRFDVLVSKYTMTHLCDWKRAICYFIKYDLTNYYGRMRRLLQLGSVNTKLSFTLRYGKKQAKIKWVNYKSLALKNLSNTKEYWLSRGYSDSDAELQISEVQTERSNISASKTKGSSEHSVRCVAFWMKKGYSEKEAIQKVGEYQRRNHTEERNQRWQQTLKSKPIEEQQLINRKKGNSIKGIMLRGHTEEEAVEINRLIFENQPRAKFRGFSKISQRMFEMIAKKLGPDGLYFNTLNYEKNFRGKLVDFYDQHTGVVIEYMGDWYHSNPMKYPGNFQHRQGVYAAHIRLDDSRRTEKILEDSRVENVYYVWDSEFRTNPTEVVNLIIDFIVEKRSSKSLD